MGARGRVHPSFPGEIGAYEIRGLLGRGATAIVYEGRHRTLGRRAAVKVLHPHLARDDIAAARFLREGRAISRIAHPNVVEVFDVGEHEGTPYLVMSLVDGEDLREHIRRVHPLSMADVADLVLPVIAAVAAAHDAGIIHRDLKPSNIRLTRDHRGTLVPKVLDFGISKLTDDEPPSDLTDTDGALGTASYMAPEQLRSAKHVDARCDVYAIGVILYECATGARPFRGASGYDLMHAILTAPVAPPSFARPEIPPAFDAIVLRAMRREVSERFGSARELGRALAPFGSDAAAGRMELAGRASDPMVLGPEKADPGEQTFTLVSASETRPAGRTLRISIAVAAAVAVGGLAGAVAIRAARTAPPVSTASAISAAQVAATSEASSVAATSREMPAPETAQGPDLVKASLPNALVSPTAQRANPSRNTVQPKSPVTARGAPSEETGTNGAPILE
jgi:serine/threonine-protein kinase